jgi:biopolymer transport protein ExbB
MLQVIIAAAAAAPNAGGTSAATALSKMGAANLLAEMVAQPGHYAVSWIVLLTLTLMSVLSIYWIVMNFIKNLRLKGTSDRVISTFW